MKIYKKPFIILAFIFSSQFLISQSNTNYGTSAGYGGSYNSCFGYYAGDVVTALGNTFSGYYAGKLTSSGNYNVFNGYYSGYTNTLGGYNVYVGYRAGSSAKGNYNVAIGYLSAYALSTGSDNVFLGWGAGRNSGVGSRNVFLGYAGGYSASGSDNVFLGYQAGYSASGSDKLYIENSTSNSPLIYGEFNNNLLAINGKLGVGTTDFGTGQLVVDGKIKASKIIITSDHFPDYVFEENYQLMSIREIDAHIKTNKHLPGIKPANEVKSEGLYLGEINIKLLEKIEELTLHIINLDKKKKEIEKQNSKIRKEIEKMHSTI